MKNRKHQLLLCLFSILFAACSSEIKYPDKLPEASKIDESIYNGITTKTYYDKDGNVFRIAHFNEKNEPCTDVTYGAAETIILTNGNISETTYYDSTRHVMINAPLGYARCRMTYNKDRYILEEAYYGIDNKLIVPNTDYQNYAMQKYEYDANNLITKSTSYDANKKVILPIITYDYDSNNNTSKVSNVDEKGKLIPCKQGYAYAEYKYSKDNLSEYSYHDAKGNLVMVEMETPDNADDEASTISHARGVWAYFENKDTTSILSLYDKDNKLIKEFAYNDYDNEGAVGYYKAINDNTFSDTREMNDVLTFACKALLKVKADGNAFKILQNWSYFCYNRSQEFYNALRVWYEPKLWEKDPNGRKRSSEEMGEKNDSIAWDMSYITDYLSAQPNKVLLAFENVKPLLRQFVTKDLYVKSGSSLLVTTALSAYDDIQKKGAQSTLENINSVMKISETANFYQTADLYTPMKQHISISISDINAKLSEEEKKEVIVWAYSFWLRRNNEKSTNAALQLLKQIDEMYQ